jgi:transcriptional regulator GlxA family with amidase domain
VITTGVLLFDDVEELDVVGPWEVFGAAAHVMRSEDRVVSIAQTIRPIRAAKGLTFVPACSFETAPVLDVLVVPGGIGTRAEARNPALIAWIRTVASRCRWVTSVCTGTLLLHEAGLVAGKRVTTHWSFVETLRARGNVTVLDDRRYVQDGNVVTAAGVSAGIDMALWLVGELHGEDVRRDVRRYIQYDPEPP